MAQALDKELNAAVKPSDLSQAVNDLTGIVKKKRKAPAAEATDAASATEANGAKRKAEDEASPTEKKARLETSS